MVFKQDKNESQVSNCIFLSPCVYHCITDKCFSLYTDHFMDTADGNRVKNLILTCDLTISHNRKTDGVLRSILQNVKSFVAMKGNINKTRSRLLLWCLNSI
ncbi:hypothetical protein FKM82_022637 [Ascaphus truei]